MKNYEETIETVFDRIGTYKAKQARRRKIVVRTVAPLCCLCLIGAAVFGIRQDTVPEQALEDALYPGIKDTFDVSKGEDPDDPAANNKIIINPVDQIPESRMDIALLWDDFVEMTQEEINSYYGVNVLPEVPGDMMLWENSVWGIFRRDNGTGDIYYDQNIYNFSNADMTKNIHMTVAKGNMVFLCYVIKISDAANSIINNHEVAITQSSDGSYLAEFMYKNVGFYITFQGITQEEMVSVIESIIE